MKTSYYSLLVLSFIFTLPGCVEQAQENSAEPKTMMHEQGKAPVQLELPDNLAGVLRQEMQLLEKGMGELLGHIVAGRSGDAAAVALKIEKSFVLKQALTQEELKQLIGLLPAEFITMDRKFHSDAGALAAAAEKGEFRTAMKLYTTMAESCLACHSQYAAQRFPKLAH